MSASPAEPTPDPKSQESPVATATPDPKPDPKPEPEPEPKSVPEPKANPWDNPETAQAEIERLRRENGAARTNAKAQAAEEAKKELAQTIGKALGLVEDEAIDPAKLTESLTAAQSEAKQAQVALAVYQNATTAGGDPVALLDSTSFLKSLEGVDPTDATAVNAAIKSAIEANPRLGAAPGTPRTPAPNPAQGSSGGGAPDLESQIAAAQKAGNSRLAIHLENQKLAQRA